MRPPSIVLFERLYLRGLAVGLVNSALLVTSVSEAEFAAEGTSFFGILATALVISLLLWFFVAHRRSSIAKWILIALFALGLLGLPAILGEGVFDVTDGLTVATWLLQAAAIWMLFRPDSAEWFRGSHSGDAATIGDRSPGS